PENLSRGRKGLDGRGEEMGPPSPYGEILMLSLPSRNFKVILRGFEREMRFIFASPLKTAETSRPGRLHQ
ncbi:MAG: hypothetical protein LBO05_04350, partial [Deltaproteobacteria bacterium]|nr:hypothetical protein [Deltaproteobacteria bacterium]